jgi:hypothetical protein
MRSRNHMGEVVGVEDCSGASGMWMDGKAWVFEQLGPPDVYKMTSETGDEGMLEDWFCK